MKKKTAKEVEIITIGAPIVSALSKDDFIVLISSLEFQIRDYYKDKEKGYEIIDGNKKWIVRN